MDSLLNGGNAAFLDEQWRAWKADPTSVDPEWQELFASMDDGPSNGGPVAGALPSFRPRSIFDPLGQGTAHQAGALQGAREEARVSTLINAYRVRGHMAAHIDPLGRRDVINHPELTLEYYGLSQADLSKTFPTWPMYGMPDTAPLGAILARLRAAYCTSIGAEFMNLNITSQKQWVIEQLETLPDRHVLEHDEEVRIYRRMCDAENFERMLHTRFPGTKRFSLEGGETLIPLLDLVISHAGRRGVKEVVLGMAHRGRLNALVNILEKPAHLVVQEFNDVHGSTQGSGDVKYHKGYSADVRTVHGDEVHLSLTPNPSHLEAVNTIVLGRTRAKQDRYGDPDKTLALPLLLHGDAAFAGQGLVAETLNLSELGGYRTGGCLHIIVNNQIGFTTPTEKARSTPYATDVARMLGIPIFHVNGEDPRAVAAVCDLAIAWRQTFHRDVIIDMYCYRLHGHNEGDEPSFTQPLMYEVIRNRPSPRSVYAERLVGLGDVSVEEVEAINKASYDAMLEVSEPKSQAPVQLERDEYRGVDAKTEDPDMALYFQVDTTKVVKAKKDEEVASEFKGLWFQYSGGDIEDCDTTFHKDRLVELLEKANAIPDGFTAHRKIKRLTKQRLAMARGETPLDWAMGEQAAFATLLDAGYPVRLSGQDVGRGTFSHRHAVITDTKTGDNYFGLANLHDEQGRFYALESMLSEAGVLGFEVGYSMDTPDGLVMWEAQFGDFANGAQVIIDQFIAASETKWSRYLGVVMLLPHGHEGQGPEHSSARPERYLGACAEQNMQICNVTNPAQYFHMMRAQVLATVRKPLVVFTPKSLLRHAEATSTLDELATGRFHEVLGETDELGDVKRVVMCSGKLYYELRKRRREMGQDQVALVRVERLYPFPHKAIQAELDKYPDAELVWCQEESKNGGAWPSMLQWFLDDLGTVPRYVGRAASAAPATGSHKQHLSEQNALITEALTL